MARLGWGNLGRPRLHPDMASTHASARFGQAELDPGLHTFLGGESELVPRAPGGWHSSLQGLQLEVRNAGFPGQTGTGSPEASAPPYAANFTVWTSCISHFLLEGWES